MEIRKAEISDLAVIMAIMEDARRFQRQCGFVQWLDGYPPQERIREDILSRHARLFTIEGNPAGYAFLAEGDGDYDLHADLWEFPIQRYGAIHRLAASAEYRGRGLASAMLRLCEADYMKRGIRVVRADTGVDNLRMQHLMERSGYCCRGFRELTWGGRLCYEKFLGQ